MNVIGKAKEFFSIGNEYADDRKQLNKIFSITGPAFAELFLISLISAINMAMVGKISPDAMTGVGLTNQPLFLLLAIFQSINVGTTALVSWSIGEGNFKRSGYILKQAIIFNFIFGVLLAGLGYLVTPFLMHFLSENDNIANYSIQFMQITSFSLIFAGITMGISAALRGMGETRIPMIYNLASNVLNVILNYVLIYGKFGFPRLEVVGSGIAVLTARFFSFLFAMYVVLFWKKSPLKVRKEGGIKPDMEVLRDFLNIGLPAAGEQFVIQGGLILFSKIVVSIGDVEAAAHQIIASVNNMAFSVSQSFSISNTALVGQAVGAQDYKLAEKNTVLSQKAARFTSMAVAVIVITLARPLAKFYTDDVNVIDVAIPLFIFIAMVQFSQSSQMCFSGALRGAGDTMFPLIATFIGVWCIRLVLAYTFIVVLKGGLIGAWGAFFLDQTARNFIVMQRFKSGKWRYAKEIKMAKSAEKKTRKTV